jgi:hypothetical protein
MINLKAMTIIVTATSIMIVKSVTTMPPHCFYILGKKGRIEYNKGKVAVAGG